jgi:hypothetical protein
MDMNHIQIVVKIVAPPKQYIFKDDIIFSKLLVKFVPIKSNTNSKDIFTICIWGNLSYDLMKYYIANKYLIIDGYISIKNSPNSLTLSNLPNVEKIRISVLNLYPLK